MDAREPRGRDPVEARIFLVRHGRSEGNRGAALLGRSDPPLTPMGLEEADAAGMLLQRRIRPGVRLYTSPLARARESARRIGAVLGVPVRLAPALVELDMGRLEGMTWAGAPAERARWETAPERYRFPGGEGLDDVARRASTWFEEEHRDHRGDTILVAHLFVILALTARLIHLPLEELLHLFLEPGGVVEVHRGAGTTRLHGLYPGTLL